MSKLNNCLGSCSKCHGYNSCNNEFKVSVSEYPHKYNGKYVHIFYDIEESNYTCETDNFIFYFSSAYYLTKFMRQLEENRKTMNTRLKAKFNINVIMNDLSDFDLYTTIEKRGFKVIHRDSGVTIRCLKEINLKSKIAILNA